MSGMATSIKKAAPIIVVTWILSLISTLAVVYVAPNILPLQTTQISDNAVTAEKIADTAIITTKLADGSVTSAKIQNGTLTAVDLADGSIITIKVADGAVTTAKIADSAVTAAKIGESAVTTDKIADGAVTTSKIEDSTVTSEKIADSAVVTTKLADGSVTSAKIQNGTLTAVDLADGSIITIKVADGAVTTAKIADRAVTSAKIGESAVTTDKVADGAVTTSKIEDSTVTSEKIADSAVVTTKLADGSVTSAKIQNGTLTAVDLADGSIITIKVADGAVTTAKIADGAVTTAKIADDAVTAAKIEDSAVTSEKIVDSAVITSKLADESVTSAKIENGTLKAESSFLIWRDGSTYYAKNGSTGAIQYFGTNATTIINNAISSLPTGGLVFLCDATYNIDGTISVMEKLNINIIGQSHETKLNLTQNSNTDMMKITNSNYTTIKSIYFQGNRDSQTSGRGLVVYNSERVLIERCIFYEIKQTAIYIYGETPISSLQPWINKNRIEKIGNNSSDHGIWIGDNASDAHVVDNDVGNITGSAIYVTSSGFLIETNTLWASRYGLNVYLVTSGVITGNIVDNNKLDGINIDSCSNIVVTSNIAKLNSNNQTNSWSGIYLYNSNYTIVSGNRAGAIGDYAVETQRYGIKEYGIYSDYNLIVGNNVRGNLDPTKDIYYIGSKTVVSANQGRYTIKTIS